MVESPQFVSTQDLECGKIFGSGVTPGLLTASTTEMASDYPIEK